MIEYPKIQSVYKRDQETHLFTDEFSQPEFHYLKDAEWEWTEQVDGTNVRVGHNTQLGLHNSWVEIGGRTDNAQIPVPLMHRLKELFHAEKFQAAELPPMILFGEGFGERIQKGGGNYGKVDFVLFDVLCDGLWLRRADVYDIAEKLDIQHVPIVLFGDIQHACNWIAADQPSRWGQFRAEGLVGRPSVELQTRRGHRVITKMKRKDFD